MLFRSGPKVQSTLRQATSAIASAFISSSAASKTTDTVKVNVRHHHPWWSRDNIIPFLKDMVLKIPRALAIDLYHLGRAMIWTLAAFPAGAYYLGSAVVGSSVSFARRTHNRLYGTSSTPGQRLDHQTTVLDFRCISWMLQTSLDKAVRLSALKHLAAMTTLVDFNPTLVVDCFNIFISCINANNRNVVVLQGAEKLATLSAVCFLRTFHHLSVMDPTSGVLADLRQRYNRVFHSGTDFRSLPFYHTMIRINNSVDRPVRWGNYRPPTRGHIPVSQHMAEAARIGYQKSQPQKVPRWILRFTLHSLSLDPPPPTPAVATWLSIIAIDLGCDILNTRATTLDERCVCISQMTITLTSNQCTCGASFESDSSGTYNDG